MMMESTKIEASRKIVEETKRLYGPLLARPLDEKQLLRPTFKFIQDLVKSLMVESKLLRDVFNANHFTDRRPDKRTKIEFVQKLIDFAAIHREPVASCLAAKVVAGLEPNKTNELLQSLARIGQHKLSDRDERRPRTFTKAPSSGGEKSRRRSSTVRLPSATSKTAAEPQKVTIQPETFQTSPSKVSVPALASKPTQQLVSDQSALIRAQAGEINRSPGNNIGSGQNEKNSISSTLQTKRVAQPTSSESDIAESTLFVRANLRALKETLANITKVEDSLRVSLQLTANRTLRN